MRFALLPLVLALACAGKVAGTDHHLTPQTPGSCSPGGALPPAPTGGPMPSSPATMAALLADSGAPASGAKPLPLLADAREPSEAALSLPFTVAAPSDRCQRLMHLVHVPVAISTTSKVRSIEVAFEGTPLAVVDQGKSEITETPHSYGEQVPFFKPVFSLEGIAAGPGTLQVSAYDSAHTLVGTQKIAGLHVDAAPSLIDACTIGQTAHPRIWITPDRLAAARARDPQSDQSAQRYQQAVDFFLAGLVDHPDPNTSAFSAAVDDPESYIPALGLCYQLAKDSDPVRAKKCAGAARQLVLKIAGDYDSGARDFGRDTGYDIRFGLMRLMIAYDWLYDQFSADERALLASVGVRWVDFYHTKPGYAESHPVENYFAGYLQGIQVTAVALAGEWADAQRMLDLLHEKLYWDMPVVNQRICGGDWPEGWNYGPLSVQEMLLVSQTMKDLGEDWGALFEWIEHEPLWLTYQMSPDFTELRSFGGYSGSLPHRTSAALLTVLSGATADGALAARLYKTGLATPNNDLVDERSSSVFEMLYARTDQTVDLSALKPSFFAPGTGRLISRSSMSDSTAYMVTAENMSYFFDHFGYANGDVRLYHGATCLLCPAAYRGDDFRGQDETVAFSTFVINDGAQLPLNRNDQVLFVLENDSWSAIGMRFESAYASGGYDENVIADANPLDYVIREAVHVRPATLVVRDLSRRRHAADKMAALWHLGSSEMAQTLGGGAYQIGALRVTSFSASTLTTTFTPDNDDSNARIGTLMRQDLPASTDEVEMVTVFSDVDQAISYTGGVVKLKSGSCVKFGGGTVSVQACP